MDMQYSLQTTQLINFQPYVDYIDWVTQNHDVFHFPRYDIMRHWVEDGQVDFNTETPEAKQRSFTFVHTCLGETAGRQHHVQDSGLWTGEAVRR